MTEATAHAALSVRLALEAVAHYRLRAALTSLGILFGVASVIAMLAIGRGAKEEILAQMRLLGANNVIVTPFVERGEDPKDEDEAPAEVRRFSPGLTTADVRSIAEIVPEVEAASGEIVVQTEVSREGRARPGSLVGVGARYFELVNLTLERGAGFTPRQLETAAPVAVIGHAVKVRLFPGEDPIGRRIKAGHVWLTVVGVVADRRVGAPVARKLGIRDPSMDVYLPLDAMLRRVRDRARISIRAVPLRRITDQPEEESSAQRQERLNYHQLDRVIIRVRDPRHVPAVAGVVRRMLARRHNQVTDFTVTVPELLLQQERRARTVFNVVLGAIASISLVVGGIGIMNIMLASVLERIREIGVRRALGARRLDILSQFLGEAVLISLTGGIAGILLGVGLSLGIERFAGVTTAVSPASVALAFGVSISVGLGFGIVPALRAARQDPVTCLRYE